MKMKDRFIEKSRAGRATRRLLAAILPICAVFGVASCGITEIDHYLTFVAVDTATYVVGPLSMDTVITATVHRDTALYTTQHTRPDLLGTSFVTHLFLSTTTPSFKLNGINRAILVIGSDTIADQLVSKFAVDTLSLDLRHVDITKYLKDSIYAAKVSLHLAKASAQAIQLGLTITVSQTATPVPD